VIVTSGPLAGVDGIFVRHRGRDRLVLSVSLIGRSVAVELDRMCVQPIQYRPLRPIHPQSTTSDHGAVPHANDRLP
jgi:hypothetical protein